MFIDLPGARTEEGGLHQVLLLYKVSKLKPWWFAVAQLPYVYLKRKRVRGRRYIRIVSMRRTGRGFLT